MPLAPDPDRPGSWPEALGASLIRTLCRRAMSHGERTALRFLERGERVVDAATYAELDRAARIVAGNLRSAGMARKPVVIALPQGLDYVRCFLGCLYAGAIAIPAPALGDPRGSERVESIVDHAMPALLVADPNSRMRLQRTDTPTPPLVSPADLLAGRHEVQPADPSPDDIAFLQYTSGSTSQPKGVAITHGNIASDLAMIQTAFAQTEDSSTVSWLPLHHDMGLIGCVLEPLQLGASAVLMSPLAFLQKPARWLRALDAFGATTAGAPNFGYDMCVRAITDAQVPNLDLSRWQLAFCGSEPVRAASLKRFSDRFAQYGFIQSAFYPCYGQAEATLFVTGGRPGHEPQIKDGSVGCGHPWLSGDVVLLDPRAATPVANGDVGEIAIAGPQVSPGFWDPALGVRPDPEREVRLSGRRYLRTGDLGCWRDGELHVVGRLRTMIIIRGANIHAEDVERTALAHPCANRLGAVAAFPRLDREREGLVLVCELARGEATVATGDTAAALASAVAEAHGFLPDEVLMVPSGTIERTLSGKLRRDATRDRFSQGVLPVLHRHVPVRPRAGSAS